MPSFGSSRFFELQDRLLVAVAKWAHESADYVDPVVAASAAGLSWHAGTLREAVGALERRGLLTAIYGATAKPDGGIRVAMTGKALDELEDIEANVSWRVPHDAGVIGDDVEVGVPAADRMVTLDHNSAAYVEAVKAVDGVVQAVRESNDLFTPDPDARAQVLAELEGGRKLLDATRARVSAVSAMLGPALKWLAEQAGSVVVKKLAESAWDAVKRLVGL